MYGGHLAWPIKHPHHKQPHSEQLMAWKPWSSREVSIPPPCSVLQRLFTVIYIISSGHQCNTDGAVTLVTTLHRVLVINVKHRSPSEREIWPAEVTLFTNCCPAGVGMVLCVMGETGDVQQRDACVLLKLTRRWDVSSEPRPGCRNTRYNEQCNANIHIWTIDNKLLNLMS